MEESKVLPDNQDNEPDDEIITRLLNQAASERILFHKRNGYPIIVWKDGKVVQIEPEDIEIEDTGKPSVLPEFCV